MKTRLSIPIETIHLLPYDREYSEAEATIQVIYDIETQNEWSVLKYSKQFGWSRNKVELFLQKKTFKEKLDGHRRITNSKPQPALKDRKHAFGLSLVPYIERYGKQMIREFFDYWTESGNGRMRWEDQKYFDIPRRLITWNNKRTDFGQDDKKDNALLKRMDKFEEYRKNAPDDATALVMLSKLGYKTEWLDEIVEKYGVENLTGNFNGYHKRRATYICN